MDTIQELRAENTRLKLEIEDLKAMATRCACQVPDVPACDKNCTCRTPVLSGGCARCATYGSKDQQVQAAKAIAALI